MNEQSSSRCIVRSCYTSGYIKYQNDICCYVDGLLCECNSLRHAYREYTARATIGVKISLIQVADDLYQISCLKDSVSCMIFFF